MVMSTIAYEVIGEHSAPSDFTDYAYRMLSNKEQLHIVAVQTTHDELAARRGSLDSTIEFDFHIREILTDPVPVFSGFMYTDGEKGSWVQIGVTDRVRFTILA